MLNQSLLSLELVYNVVCKKSSWDALFGALIRVCESNETQYRTVYTRRV
jgi:hypothetical protein